MLNIIRSILRRKRYLVFLFWATLSIMWKICCWNTIWTNMCMSVCAFVCTCLHICLCVFIMFVCLCIFKAVKFMISYDLFFQESNPLKKCAVCNEDFNTDSRCPRTLPCSHYLCSQCLWALINDNKMKCPYCRENFSACQVEDIMINRAIVKFLNFQTFQSKESKDATATLNHLKQDTMERIKSLTKSAKAQKLRARVVWQIYTACCKAPSV